MRDRKAQIIEAAAELLQTRSFTSFSYQDLSTKLGIKKASIHHHFPTKEDLGVALTDRFFETARTNLEAIERRSELPWERLDTYMALMFDTLESGNKICVQGILQAEHNVVPSPVSEGVSRLFRYTQNWLESVLAEGRRRGEMRYSGEPADQAALVQAALQGALQNGRAEGPEAFTAVVRQLRDSMR